MTAACEQAKREAVQRVTELLRERDGLRYALERAGRAAGDAEDEVSRLLTELSARDCGSTHLYRSASTCRHDGTCVVCELEELRKRLKEVTCC